MINSTTLSEHATVRQKEDPYKVTSELLGDGETELTCFFFHFGANFYVFSYKKKGLRRHTFIDTGDPTYQDRVFPILSRHKINPDHIERIIITHRHYDHCGLADVLAGKSGAKIIVHSNFRDFIEKPLTEEDRMWLRGFEPSRLRKCRVEYLSPGKENHTVKINGLDFPVLREPIRIGDGGSLKILACPVSSTMHSPDQIIVHYHPGSGEKNDDSLHKGRPSDHLLFSGDLWLMHGPLFPKSFRYFSLRIRLASRQVQGLLKGKKFPRRDPRLQDILAKEALKHGFLLVRVFPGHGEEFLGTRMIPLCFLSDRDLLVALGFSMDEKKSLLQSEDLILKIKTLREQAYLNLKKELRLWKECGYNSEEICGLLERIYLEQKGGGPLVKEDRLERRGRIEETLIRLRDEVGDANGFNVLAEMTLKKIRGHQGL